MTVKVVTFESERVGPRVVSFPAHYQVCSDCRGEGRTLLGSIREHAYTHDEMDEMGEDGREAYFDPASHYHEACRTCAGRRVEAIIDRERCWADRRLRRYLRLLDVSERRDREFEALCASERRMGC